MIEEAMPEVCEEILEIMKEYHCQEECGHIDTPGGFEHLGDVWKTMLRWENMLGGPE
jgi:poly-beta-hydroxyalkanoate depolymerase